MPEINAPRIGHFCWFELTTTDQAAAKRFYCELFGWTWSEFPMGPGSVYTMFKLRDRDVGACCTLQPEMQSQGVPPHWMTYVAVENADDATTKASELGGKIVVPAFDVFDVGRMAVVQDPTGATFCVWQARRHYGVGLWAEPNTICWCELMTRDTEAATRFYAELFGWGTKISTNAGFPYTHWQIAGQDIGGMMQITEQMGSVPPHWMNYFSVEDCDNTVSRATGLGGNVVCPPTNIPNTGRFAVLQDAQGAYFAIIALVPMVKG